MRTIEWRDEFSVGDPAVDLEHRELIGLINTVLEIASGPDAVARAADMLGELNAKIAAHFALEESAMRLLAYDQLRAHKADHERLLDEIRDIMDAYEAGTMARQGDALTARLEAWFVNHFKTMDARLHGFLGPSGRA
ncbi:MAG: hemerythrin family protein [Rhodospirillaceae bacterium]|nr:hemerythrin family protein [Rhodospirillaceae bacterium]